MRRVRQLDERPASRPYFVNMCFSDADRGAVVSPYLLKGEEQRRSPRQRVILSALVVHLDFRISFKCAIRDVSDQGARLKAPPGYLIPPQFLLVDIRAGKGYEAQTAWRRYPHVGVRVDAPMDLHDPLTRTARNLRALWLGHVS